MRIRTISERKRSVNTSAGSVRRQHTTDKVESAFKAQLVTVEEEMIVADLDVLLNDVDRTGLALRRWRGQEQLIAYKRAVKAFMELALQRMYRVKQQTRFNRHGARLSSLLVEAVDERLKAMTEEVIAGEKSSVPLAALLDEIRGLLLDMYG